MAAVERKRGGLARDIKGCARRIVVADGVSSLTLAAIARDLGITSPAIYRYYDGVGDIVRELAADIVTDLVNAMRRAVAEQRDTGPKLAAATRAFRQWSVEHRAEFALLFGNGSALPDPDIATDWVRRLAQVWGPLVGQAWRDHAPRITPEERLAAPLRTQLAGYRELIGADDVPLGLVLVFLDCWRQIYGMVCLEVFGHFGAAFTDHEPLFENMLAGLLHRLGVGPDPG
ncbi:TetR/AcrR family transcriptional regulator [Saccharomonospora sp. NPDC006951]